jgi:hypothetical protein
MPSHTVQGVWVVEVRYPDRPRIDRGTLLFHEGGALSLAFADYAAHAVWTAAGDRSANVRGVRPVGPNEGFVGMYELQGTITVSDDGNTCQMPAIQRRPRPDGSLIEQSMTITGQRLKIAGGRS